MLVTWRARDQDAEQQAQQPDKRVRTGQAEDIGASKTETRSAGSGADSERDVDQQVTGPCALAPEAGASSMRALGAFSRSFDARSVFARTHRFTNNIFDLLRKVLDNTTAFTWALMATGHYFRTGALLLDLTMTSNNCVFDSDAPSNTSQTSWPVDYLAPLAPDICTL